MAEIKASELPEISAENVTNNDLFVIARGDDRTFSVTWKQLKEAVQSG